MVLKVELAALVTAQDYLEKAVLFERAAASHPDDSVRADLLQIAECLRYLAVARAER